MLDGACRQNQRKDLFAGAGWGKPPNPRKQTQQRQSLMGLGGGGVGRGKPPSPQTTNEMKKDNSVPTLRRRAASEKRCCRNQAFRNNGHTGALLLSRPAPPLPTEKQLETQTINFSKDNLSDINQAANAREKLEKCKMQKNFKNMNNCQFSHFHLYRFIPLASE